MSDETGVPLTIRVADEDLTVLIDEFTFTRLEQLAERTGLTVQEVAIHCFKASLDLYKDDGTPKADILPFPLPTKS